MSVPSGHSNSSDSSSRSNSPSFLGIKLKSLLCPLFPLSIHQYHIVCALYSSFTPFLLSLLWHNSLLTPLFNSSLPFSLSAPSLLALVRACSWQSDLWELWAQLTFLVHSLTFSLSLTLLFLVPVTSLIERGALRPGNEGNGRSVKHLLFNRALLSAFCPHQEARSWTCWMTDFKGTSSLTLF